MDGNPVVEEPWTIEERREVAQRCDTALDIRPMKILIDDMKNTAGSAYAGHPDRLFLVGVEGRIAYAGERGPRGFKPDELEDAIREELKLEPLKRKKQERDDRSRRDR